MYIVNKENSLWIRLRYIVKVLFYIPSIPWFLLQLSLPLRPILSADVSYIVEHLPLWKAPSFHLVIAEVLRQLLRKSIGFLSYLYNSILGTTYFALIWKFSTIIPPTHLSPYRSISLLPLFSKIFEKLLLKVPLPILDFLATFRLDSTQLLPQIIPVHQANIQDWCGWGGEWR